MPTDHLLSQVSLQGKRVLLRLDLDVPLKDGQVLDDSRLQLALPTLRKCLSEASGTLIIGHLGRPKGIEPSLSLKPAVERLKSLLDQDIPLIPSLDGLEQWGSTTPLAVLENLRFWEGEDQNDPNFASSLANNFNVYVFDAFAASHRHSASGIGVPKLLPSLLGLQMEAELQALDPIINNPKRPITLILGGSKADKIENVDKLLTHVDNLLLGGSIITSAPDHPKLIKAQLTDDGLDVTLASIDIFRSYINSSSTLIWNGPVGKYEDGFHDKATYNLAEAVATANAYKVAGGGDTQAVISKLNLETKFNYISTGGGAMLYYLAFHSLPSLDAVNSSPTY